MPADATLRREHQSQRLRTLPEVTGYVRGPSSSQHASTFPQLTPILTLSPSSLHILPDPGCEEETSIK